QRGTAGARQRRALQGNARPVTGRPGLQSMAEPNDADADKMAAEWAAMADGPAAGGDASAGDGQSAARVLNPDEIDSLLGFDGANGSGSGTTGLQAII